MVKAAPEWVSVEGAGSRFSFFLGAKISHLAQLEGARACITSTTDIRVHFFLPASLPGNHGEDHW